MAVSLKSLLLAGMVCDDAAFEAARRWSNNELKRFAPLFTGTVLNVSAADDSDRESGKYRAYFRNAGSYLRSNFFTGRDPEPDEIHIDLEQPSPRELAGCADVVFNHTTLEHIFNCRTAFDSLCRLSKDVVIVVAPFLQQMHGMDRFNDYWRFTPETMRLMYAENGLNLRYCSNNETSYSSIYLFCIGYRDRKWDDLIPEQIQGLMHGHSQNRTGADLLGAGLLKNSFLRRFAFYRARLQRDRANKPGTFDR